MTAIRIDINPSTLRWAREAMNVDREDLARAVGVKVERVEDWESAAASPTSRQLERVAKKLLRDPAFFVGDEVPTEEPALASFRRVFNAPNAGPSPGLLREVAVARARRDDLLEIWADAGIEVQEFVLRLPADRGHQAAGQAIRQWTGVAFEQQIDTASTYAHLRLWVDALEAQSVLVFHASRISVSEFRGLALHLDAAPVILLNGGDSVSARIFTLLHEVCHLALGESDWSKSGLSPNADFESDSSTEAFCNRVAAELLVPSAELSKCALEFAPLDGRTITQIANVFKVSRAVAAIRLRQLGLIEPELLAAVLAQSRTPKKKSSGGSYYRTQVRNVGRRYTAEVLDALYAGQISRHHAASMLGARRANGLDAMRNALVGA